MNHYVDPTYQAVPRDKHGRASWKRIVEPLAFVKLETTCDLRLADLDTSSEEARRFFAALEREPGVAEALSKAGYKTNDKGHPAILQAILDTSDEPMNPTSTKSGLPSPDYSASRALGLGLATNPEIDGLRLESARGFSSEDFNKKSGINVSLFGANKLPLNNKVKVVSVYDINPKTGKPRLIYSDDLKPKLSRTGNSGGLTTPPTAAQAKLKDLERRQTIPTTNRLRANELSSGRTTRPSKLQPTQKPKPTSLPRPTQRPTPTPRPRPTQRPTPTPRPRPRPTQRPTPTPRPRPTQKPTPTPRPRPTQRPTPTPRPRPTQKPTPTPRPRPTQKPMPTPRPRPTQRPTPTPRPQATGKPTPTPRPAPRPRPVRTPRPAPRPRPTPAPRSIRIPRSQPPTPPIKRPPPPPPPPPPPRPVPPPPPAPRPAPAIRR